ncbi:MAG: hypothetical protein AABX27_00850 [Nanoarchaeota archaeon]
MLKRGQITLYVAFGLVVVALIVLLVLTRQGVFLTDWEKERRQALDVPEQAKEMNDYIQGCVGSIADEGITLLGMQGGYIQLPAEKNIPGLANPFTENLEILPQMKTPFWFYIEPNRIQKTAIPTLTEMETALAGYINNRLGECTLNTALFEKFNASYSTPKTSVVIQTDKVLITSDFPVKINVEDFVYRIPKIYFEVDARIGEMYNIGKEIIRKDNSDLYLEEKTIDILAMYKGIPYSSTEFSCAPKIWTKTGVKEELKTALNANMQSIQLKNTNTGSSNNYFLWDALAKSHKQISASFRFSKQWPVKMEVFPSEGELLTAKPFNDMGNSAMAFITALFCLNDYHFVYDVQYPLAITLSDENGYIFQFATMVLIDNNQPRENKEGTLDVPQPEEKICKNMQGHATIYALAPDEKGDLQPVTGAEIKLKCVTTVCPVGKTKFDRDSRETYIKADVPQCANALLTASKEGYFDAKQTVDTIEEDTYSLMLQPYKEFDYEIIVVEEGFERGLENSETAIINIQNKDNGFGTSVSSGTGKVKLISGRFELKSTIIAQGFEINIKGKEITHCTESPTRNLLGLLGFTEKQCTTANTPDMTLDQVISGGSTTVWDLSRQDFSSGSKITFYVPASSIPTTVDEMEQAFAMADDPVNAKIPKVE